MKLGLRVGELRNIKLEDLALSQSGLDIEAELDALREGSGSPTTSETMPSPRPRTSPESRSHS
ncbi:hypothetical protein BRC89_13270 [Halobacteriales archaeon QS_4_70_19]|nr:MAG: hypothetical protein BRC89_13270 [Halobacteriales archaeon QS_4_70_19]